jgi:outer membrane lipopolysaccharide assembly protein LptE/RlpB
MFIKHLRTVAGLLAVVLATSSCGYALAGRGNTLPSEIRIIGVPQFVNQSTTAGIDGPITDAVRAEWQSRGRFRQQPDASNVDAVMTGTILNVVLQPVAFTADGQASRYQIVVVASVEFRLIKDNKVHWTNPSFQLREEYPVTIGNSPTDVNALLRTDSNATERLARNFARSIVTSILEAF